MSQARMGGITDHGEQNQSTRLSICDRLIQRLLPGDQLAISQAQEPIPDSHVRSDQDVYNVGI
jgi:hypothetical protein